MSFHFERRVIRCAVVLGLAAAGCASSGPAAFRRSQQAAMPMDHFTVEIAQSTVMGEFKDTKAIDCSAQYFYELDARDLSDYGIEQNKTISEQHPKRHHESEMMFSNGRTYGRNSGTWENPALGDDDAYPDWHPLSASRDPREECAAMKAGTSFGFVNYPKIFQSAKTEYLGKQRVNGHKCADYQTTYPDRTYTDTKICLGTKDDLPYRVVGADFTVTYNYDDVQKVPLPEQPAPTQPQ